MDYELESVLDILLDVYIGIVVLCNMMMVELEVLSMVKNGLCLKEIVFYLGVIEGVVK